MTRNAEAAKTLSEVNHNMSSEPPPTIRARTTVLLEQPPCCMQFVPDLKDHFVIGTYQYEEPKTPGAKGSRTGSLVLFRSDESKL